MKKLTNTTKVLRYVRSHPKAKAKEVSLATGVTVTSVYQIVHKSKKDQALTMSASPAVLLKYPPKRGKKPSLDETLQDMADILNKGRKPDNVNHPAHYKVGGIETIDFIEAKSLNYNLGNVVKYITRADHKGSRMIDLKTAQWYLNREVSNLEKAK